jgi:hypothetical protein
MIAWNQDGTVFVSRLNSEAGNRIISAAVNNVFVEPSSVVWTPMRWVTSGATGQSLPPPANPPTNTTCNLPTRLAQGNRVYVNAGPPNNVRAAASARATVIGTLPAGTVAQLMEGPLCADGFYWWRIGNETLSGWTAEGGNGQYWLSQYSEAFCRAASPDTPIQMGMTAYVLPGDPNVLRDGPGTNSNRIGSIPANGQFRVVGTALCGNDGRRWWPVNYNGTYGWTGEGEGNTFWIAPAD